MRFEEVQGYEILKEFLTARNGEEALLAVVSHPELRDPGAVDALDALISRAHQLDHASARQMQWARDWLAHDGTRKIIDALK